MKTQAEMLEEMERRKEADWINTVRPFVERAESKTLELADFLKVLESDIDDYRPPHPVKAALDHIAQARVLLERHVEELERPETPETEQSESAGTIRIQPKREWHCPKCGSIIIVRSDENDEIVCSCGEKIDPFYSVPCNNRR